VKLSEQIKIPPMEKVNILLVDDQPGTLLAYQTILGDLDVNLVLAKSGREALQSLLKQNNFALILLDVVMPDIDGFETATLIRQHPRLVQTPIIFVTALSMSDLDRRKGYELGAVDYVFAPVVPDILRAKVSVFVELYRKRQELQREIAERQQAEDALLHQTRILQSVLDSMADAVIVVDAEGKLLLFNPAAEQIHSVSLADAISGEATAGYGLFLPDMTTPCLAGDLPLTRVLRGETADTVEMFLRHPTAPKGVWLSTNARSLKGENGTLSGGVAVIRDITESKLAEQELRNSREQLRNLSAYLQSVREEERARIAREIHDELGQTLTALKMDVSWVRGKLPTNQETLLQKTKAMLKLIDTTIQSVQRIAAELRPGMLDELGLSAAIEWQIQKFRERSNIACEIIQRPENIVVDRERSTAIFRILQEALTNVARHALATKVCINLTLSRKALLLKVRDDGRGISATNIANAKSIGLIGMRERVYPWRGRVTIKGVPGKGTIVLVRIPV
jgi:signal transduction histidine kinase